VLEVFRHVGKSKSIQRGVQSQRAVVEYELPFHALSAIGWQANIYAIVRR